MLRYKDDFAGWGGSSLGMSAVPGVELVFAGNHDPLAVEVHADNFPHAEHYCGDIAAADVTAFPPADLYWASPVCPPWSNARGVRRNFDRSTQTLLFDGLGGEPDAKTARGRALMEEIPRYLGAMIRRGSPVLAGVVENVIEVRKWDQWHRWLSEFHSMGYRTRVIALNSMHVRPIRTLACPQSRDRAYVAYWWAGLGRDPDWDKWLRPTAYCPTCDAVVDAVQVFKKPGVDMGRYGRHGQYHYRCPRTTCRHQILEPEVLPALAAIDWSLHPGPKIGERARPLEDATIARIRGGLARYGPAGLLSPAGGTRREHASPLHAPMPTRTTRENDALVLPPPLPPFLATLRGGGSKTSGTRGVDEPLATFSAKGTHHALVCPPGGQMLLPYYRTGTPRPVTTPIGTLTTRDRYALIGTPDQPGPGPAELPAVEECTFRMLAVAEIARGMSFTPDYRVKGPKTAQVRGLGNAVTPPVGEILGAALVETITGQAIDPAPHHVPRKVAA